MTAVPEPAVTGFGEAAENDTGAASATADVEVAAGAGRDAAGRDCVQWSRRCPQLPARTDRLRLVEERVNHLLPAFVAALNSVERVVSGVGALAVSALG